MCYRFDQIHQVEGKRAGWEVHKEDGVTRLSNSLNKTTEFDDCLYIKPLLAAAYHLLKSGFKVYGFNIRDVSPGHGHHRLTAIMVQLPVDNYSVLNSMILLAPFTADNGATRIVPGSHLSGLQAEDVMGNTLEPHPDEIHLTVTVGSVVILNAHTWHGGTLNVSGERRRVGDLAYCLVGATRFYDANTV